MRGNQKSTDDQGGSSAPEIRLDDAAQSAIGRQLRAVYSEIVQEPVPDQFLKLLDELARKEQS